MKQDRYIRALGYVGFTSARLEDWRIFGTGILGLQDVSATDAAETELRLRMDERSWRIAVAAGAEEGLAYLGWETASHDALAALVDRLTGHGLDVVEEPPRLARHRGVAKLYSSHDPDGNRMEFYWGPTADPDPFHSPAGVEFVAGPLGVGHIVLRTVEFDACNEFYRNVLGFGLSDYLIAPPRLINFLHVNERHHSLALIQGDPAAPSVSHLMLEPTHVDMVGRALDRVYASGAKPVVGLGRHVNDRMISSYLETPSGFRLEYGAGGRLIDPATHVSTNHTGDKVWGHQRS
ncbi:VOC family protein [Embleya hyalina]|uniref:Putative 2,3-dihydroxybiphenyl 1,2-dioxygenase n=1 Tax=Embleya hyalina TaxID=516124 RepID=A0A401YN17_9ACTN|nr:VOC family protein [Embleya hyalina]GCD96010.1 putative 2,3-dihydroxybiphenyl 1,2-dioxygenase [Embleya hyalina]